MTNLPVHDPVMDAVKGLRCFGCDPPPGRTRLAADVGRLPPADPRADPRGPRQLPGARVMSGPNVEEPCPPRCPSCETAVEGHPVTAPGGVTTRDPDALRASAASDGMSATQAHGVYSTFAGGGQATVYCECDWMVDMDTLAEARAEHAKHAAQEAGAR